MPPAPFWNGQAVATLIAAVLVVGSAVATLWQNWCRLAREQREKRARDREQALQEQYGDFAAAAFEYGHIAFALRLNAMNLHGFMNAPRNEFNDAQLARTQSLGDEIRSRASASLAAMLSAQARLRLLHDAPDCLEALDGFYRRCENSCQHEPKEKTKFEDELRAFLAKVAKRIHREYLIAVVKPQVITPEVVAAWETEEQPRSVIVNPLPQPQPAQVSQA